MFAAAILLVLPVSLGQQNCPSLANTRCDVLDPSGSCGGRACSDRLECDPGTGRCASLPYRDYGEPCDALVRPCRSGLRCSAACGICVDGAEDDLAPLPPRDDGPSSASACGMSSDIVFRTWAGTVLTDHPVLLPKGDGELRTILSRAKEGGCKVRPMGSSHSAPGVVAEEGGEGDVVVISLAEYVSSDPDWAGPTLVGSGDAATARVPAGATQLELYAAIRPRGYFLPTQTAGWLFTMGGIVGNFVHGGAFGKGPVHNHVVSLRVMKHDGAVDIVDDAVNLSYWRNSFGLLGLILGVEVEVVRRPSFFFGTLPLTTVPGGWTRSNFESYVADVRSSHTAAEFFMNPHTREILAVVQGDRRYETVVPPISDGECKWNFWRAECRPRDKCSYQYNYGDWSLSQSCRSKVRPSPTADGMCAWDYAVGTCRQPRHCSYQYELGDLNLDQSCRLTIPAPPGRAAMEAEYAKLLENNKQLGLDGVPLGDDRLQQAAFCLASRVGLERLMLEQSLTEIARLVREAYEATNDGFFIGESIPLPTPFLGYLVPAEWLFDVLHAITELEYVLSAPTEWRYVTFDEDEAAVLQPAVTPGEWAAVEVVSIEIPEFTPADWRFQFWQIERIFRSVGGVPHTGKYFGMAANRESGLMEPFREGLEDLVEEGRRDSFRAYAHTVDPEGLFRSGYMANAIF